MQLAVAAALPAGAPEELVLPCFEVVRFVEKGKYAGEDAYAIESIALGSKLGIGERRVVSQDAEARRYSEDQRLEVGKIAVACAADVGWGEEGEDILGGLGELPELRTSVSDPYAQRQSRAVGHDAGQQEGHEGTGKLTPVQ